MPNGVNPACLLCKSPADALSMVKLANGEVHAICADCQRWIEIEELEK